MNTVIIEQPAQYFEGKPKDSDQVVDEFSSSFFYFRVELPTFIVSLAEEMSDADMLSAAEATGTFRFLDAEGENAYRP